ncbi:MAG: hypothetical protein NTX44_11945 [Ignavibacteriales bacterium]|nr:hypothetical protein [Ignavibacteriales bacterium]
MSKSCCIKPIAKIINVGNFDAGIIGLEETLKHIYVSGIKDEEQLKTELLQLVKDYGNYISPGTESDYKDALFREYRKFIEKQNKE